MRVTWPLLVVVLFGCAGARPSRWESRPPAAAPKTVCVCDGVERSPTPAEASSETDPNVVTMMCEGRVHDCSPISAHGRYLD